MYKIIHFLLSLPKSIYFNLKVFSLKTAIRLPVIVDYRTMMHGLYKGCFVLDFTCKKTGCVKLGWGNGSLGNRCNSNNYIIIHGKGHFIFKSGGSIIARGMTLRSDNNGCVVFGKNFCANQNFSVFTNTKITFGDNCVLGWNVNVRDSDGHPIKDFDGNIINPNKPICIGNSVWIASHVDILKGSSIPDGCVLGFKSLLTSKFKDENCIIAGIPAKILKKNIHWEV